MATSRVNELKGQIRELQQELHVLILNKEKELAESMQASLCNIEENIHNAQNQSTENTDNTVEVKKNQSAENTDTTVKDERKFKALTVLIGRKAHLSEKDQRLSPRLSKDQNWKIG